MRFVRFRHGAEITFGVLEEEVVRVIKPDPFSDWRETGERFLLTDVTLLAPCVPTKVVAVGLNYTDHAAELSMDIPDEPILFLKPAESVIGPGERIIYPAASQQVDYEAELGIVIKKTAKNISEDNTSGYILGYTCANDVTARDLQRKDGQWTRAKSFDTFAPIGPWIDTEFDPSDAVVEARLNGQAKQSSSTADMIFSVPRLVSFISDVMTLNPGDVIMTGTPPGVGPMKSGDTIEIAIEGLGVLVNKVGG
ncbi:MAG: fumarylacetoacetate hydrolase family protein [Actinomycetota bacterium]